jgi:hypothetical protein
MSSTFDELYYKNQIISILQNNLVDPLKDSTGSSLRSGSYIWDSTDEIISTKYTPKIQVVYSDSDIERRSYGTNHLRRKSKVYDIIVLTARGVSGSGITYKNEDMIHYLYNQIEQTILTHCGSMNGAEVHMVPQDNPVWNTDKTVCIGVYPVQVMWMKE